MRRIVRDARYGVCERNLDLLMDIARTVSEENPGTIVRVGFRHLQSRLFQRHNALGGRCEITRSQPLCSNPYRIGG